MEIENTCARFCDHVVDHWSDHERGQGLEDVVSGVYGPGSRALGPLALLWVWRGALKFLDCWLGPQETYFTKETSLTQQNHRQWQVLYACCCFSLDREKRDWYMRACHRRCAFRMEFPLYLYFNIRVLFERSWLFLTVWRIRAESVLLMRTYCCFSRTYSQQNRTESVPGIFAKSEIV